MKLTRLFLTLVAGSVFFVSCSDNDNENTTTTDGYANGTFVLNEGSSGPTTASVTFISDDGKLIEDVFTLENPSEIGTGSYLQSIFMDDTRAFIVSGQANKVTVVDRYTFKHIATIATGFSNPRYGAIVNGKAYVTNNGDWETGSDDYLTVINLADYSVGAPIAINDWADEIIEENSKLYIANGSFGKGTAVTVIDPAQSSAAPTVIALADTPESFDEEDGILYVLGDAQITKINTATNQIVGTIPLPGSLAGSSHLVIEDDKIYFANGTSVYAMSITATVAPTVPLFTTTGIATLYGLNVNDNKVYVADGGNFSSNSNAYIYTTTGSFITSYPVGVGPNGFYFNN